MRLNGKLKNEEDNNDKLLADKDMNKTEIASKVDAFDVQQILEPLLAAIKELNLDFSSVRRETNSADLTDDEKSKEGEKKKRKGRRNDKNEKRKGEKSEEYKEEEKNRTDDGVYREGNGGGGERYKDGDANDGGSEGRSETAGTSVYNSEEEGEGEGEGHYNDNSDDDNDSDEEEGEEGEEEEEEEGVNLAVEKLHEEEEKEREVRAFKRNNFNELKHRIVPRTSIS